MTSLLESAIAFALYCWGAAGLAFALNQIAEAQSWRTDDEGEGWKRGGETKHT